MKRSPGAGLAYLLILVLASMTAYSCAGPIAVSRGRYNDELRRWTREAKVYSSLEERLSVVATYRGPSFKSAYSDYYARSFGLSDTEKSRLMAKDKTEEAQYSEFLISVHTSEARLNNLDSKKSPWKIYLSDSSGRRCEPLSILKVDRADPVRGAFFPYIDLWSTAYVLRFPRYPEPGKAPVPAEDSTYLKLTISSVLGEVVLEWPLKAGER